MLSRTDRLRQVQARLQTLLDTIEDLQFDLEGCTDIAEKWQMDSKIEKMENEYQRLEVIEKGLLPDKATLRESCSLKTKNAWAAFEGLGTANGAANGASESHTTSGVAESAAVIG